MEGNRIDLSGNNAGVPFQSKTQALLRLHQSANSYYAGLAEANEGFGPGIPPDTLYGNEQPRLFEYQPGINLVTTPRVGYDVLPFGVLRSLGSACKEIRLNIELIKRQIRGLEWEIVPNKKNVGTSAFMSAAEDQNARTVEEFFDIPDGINDFDAWLNMLIEELLVTDAVTLYPQVDVLTGKFTLEVIDGTTIRTLVDMNGRTPRPPQPAYIQMLYGMPSTHYTARDLLYRPLNTKVYTPYGESPIEWVLTMINTAIRNDAQRIGYFTDGNIPAAFGFLPDSWTPDQIETWSQYFDHLVKGDMNRANKIIWLPGGNGSQNPVYPFMQNDVDKIDVDKYLMQVACWAFGNSPAEFGIVPGEGLGGKGFMQGSENMQYRSMFWPITGYLHSLFNLVIKRYLKRPDLKFQWIGLDPVPDKMQMAQVDQMYVSMGAYSLSYVQDRLGVPQDFRPKTAPSIYPNGNFNSLLNGADSPYFTRAVKADLSVWRDKVERSIKKGWNLPSFESEVIPESLAAKINSDLTGVGSVKEVREVFDSATENLEQPAKAVPAEVDGADEFFRYP